MKAPEEIYIPKEYIQSKTLPVGVTKKAVFEGDIRYIRADLVKLTWMDVAMIITIYEQEMANGNIARYGTASDVKPYAQIVLNRFLESKKEG